MLVNNLIISSQSEFIESNCSFVIYSASFNKSNQYFVSAASFSAIYNFDKKSLVLIANSASAIFAPIEVPARSICFDKTNSL